MSVHKAGSHFGVPHSTLEYKVKERHLNRGRTKKDTSGSVQANNATVKALAPLPSRPTMVPTESFMEKNLLNREVPMRLGTRDHSTIDLTDDSHGLSLNAVVEPHNLSKNRNHDRPETTDDAEPIPPPKFPPSNPFNIWDSTSRPSLPPFLTNPYEHNESFYASQMIRRFQEAASINPFAKDFAATKIGQIPHALPTDNGSRSPIRAHSSGSCSPNMEKGTT